MGDFDQIGEAAKGIVERLRTGDTRALARAISLIEDGNALGAEVAKISQQYAGNAVRIGITGPPGAGKSTLVDGMVRQLRQAGKRIGVVAVDPSSPYTGGALLGDRIRMQEFASDEGVYIRSMASRGARGGLASAVADACSVIATAGYPLILIETMGVGQDEIEITRLADITVLVLVPGMGDEVQCLKAGIMEVADVFVVNKSDREGAEQVEAQILAMQRLATKEESKAVPVIRTIATSGAGIGQLVDAVWKRASLKKEESQQKPRFIEDGLRLDHLGMAVKSIASARGFYEALGLSVQQEEIVEHEKVRTAMLPLGESRIELLEPTEADSVIGRFLAKRGEGLHHIAFHVDELDAMFEKLKMQGVKLVSDSIQAGAGGHRYFFVHPASTGGVLLEIVGDAAGRET
ncbi:MAG TPA: methylmalonyl Co-A mutase-associated GTPase MeaB [Edaphobacter sp.]|nr:methylmalonyl Co-A mutase-associated GTPase MeaB [Edaphobacter sp.]